MATRQPPPEPYETWLDCMLNPHRNGYETCVGRAAAELAELRAEDETSHALIVKQAKLLTGVANALRGEPEPLHLHSHHDLPELAAELRAELERLRAFYDSVTSTQSATVPPSTTYTIFGAGDTTGHNPCDPADEYLRTARKA